MVPCLSRGERESSGSSSPAGEKQSSINPPLVREETEECEE